MWGLLGNLNAFLQKHRRACGEMDGGVENGRVWKTRDGSGAALAQRLEADDGPIAEPA